MWWIWWAGPGKNDYMAQMVISGSMERSTELNLHSSYWGSGTEHEMQVWERGLRDSSQCTYICIRKRGDRETAFNVHISPRTVAVILDSGCFVAIIILSVPPPPLPPCQLMRSTVLRILQLFCICKLGDKSRWELFFKKGGTVAQLLALLPHSTRSRVQFQAWITVCVEFARSPRVCIGFLPVL